MELRIGTPEVRTIQIGCSNPKLGGCVTVNDFPILENLKLGENNINCVDGLTNNTTLTAVDFKKNCLTQCLPFLGNKPNFQCLQISSNLIKGQYYNFSHGINTGVNADNMPPTLKTININQNTCKPNYDGAGYQPTANNSISGSNFGAFPPNIRSLFASGNPFLSGMMSAFPVNMRFLQTFNSNGTFFGGCGANHVPSMSADFTPMQANFKTSCGSTAGDCVGPSTCLKVVNLFGVELSGRINRNDAQTLSFVTNAPGYCPMDSNTNCVRYGLSAMEKFYLGSSPTHPPGTTASICKNNGMQHIFFEGCSFSCKTKGQECANMIPNIGAYGGPPNMHFFGLRNFQRKRCNNSRPGGSLFGYCCNIGIAGDPLSGHMWTGGPAVTGYDFGFNYMNGIQVLNLLSGICYTAVRCNIQNGCINFEGNFAPAYLNVNCSCSFANNNYRWKGGVGNCYATSTVASPAGQCGTSVGAAYFKLVCPPPGGCGWCIKLPTTAFFDWCSSNRTCCRAVRYQDGLICTRGKVEGTMCSNNGC